MLIKRLGGWEMEWETVESYIHCEDMIQVHFTKITLEWLLFQLLIYILPIISIFSFSDQNKRLTSFLSQGRFGERIGFGEGAS